MAKYYFHMRNDAEELLDPEGVEMLSKRVPVYALLTARDCMAGDVRSGYLNLDYRIDVHEANGRLVHSLRFCDAVSIGGAAL
jgi:hypothetical protein